MSETSVKAEKEETKAPKLELGDIVLAKLKGFPPWPGHIADPTKIPARVAREKPKGGSQLCIRFFPQGDYAWLGPKEVSLLSPEQIDELLSKNAKRKDLVLGLKTAKDPKEWLEARANDMDVDEEPDYDELEEDAKKGGRKRKRENAKKRKSKAGDDDDEEPVVGKKKKGAAKRRRADSEEGPKSKKNKRDEEDENDDPEATKIKGWRHDLQRGFLRQGHPIEEGDLPGHNETFNVIETYQGMTVDYLQYSKIGKVMKKISQLSDEAIPNNDSHEFRRRASELVNKWQGILSKPEDDAPGEAAPDAPAATTTAETEFKVDTKSETKADPEPETKAAAEDSSAPANGDVSILNGDVSMLTEA